MVGMKERIVALDNVKFILIILVLYGHLKSVCTIIPFSANIIYSFHMPLFMFISGFLSKKGNKDDFRTTINYIRVYLTFQFIHILPSLIHGSYSLRYLYVPEWTLWYIFVLILYRTVLQIAPKMGGGIIVISVLLSLLMGFVPLNSQFAFQRIFTFAPYFIMGFWFKQHYSYIELTKKITNELVGLSIFMSVCLLVIIPFEYYWGDYSYYDYNRPILLSFLYKLMSYLCAICMSIPILKFIPNKVWPCCIKDTLFYYMYHSLIIIPFMQLFITKLNLPTEWYFSIVYFIILVIGLGIMHRIELFRYLVK